MANTPTYKSWISMRQRCENPNNSAFHLYGGAGIFVCERWQSFDKFLEDMGQRPEGCTLDRVDGSKGYSPDNCRWATPLEQSANTRQSILVSAFGETKTITQWSKDQRCIVSNATLAKRIRSGWNAETALTTKLKDSGPK